MALLEDQILAGGVLRIKINRPEVRNALSRAAMRELTALLTRHAQDSTLRVLVLSAAGERAFCAGGDLRDADTTRDEQGAKEFCEFGMQALDALRNFPAPVIAALNGLAYGGGSELALACDMRIAAAHAEIGFIQSTMNIATAWGGGSDLMRLVGYGRAIELLSFGRKLSAREAHALGVFNAVAEADEHFATFIDRFIGPLAQCEPSVLRALKAQAMAERFGLPIRETRPDVARRFIETWRSAAHWQRADSALAPKK